MLMNIQPGKSIGGLLDQADQKLTWTKKRMNSLLARSHRALSLKMKS